MSHLFTMAGLTATCGKRTFAFESWEQVSRAYRAAIDSLGLGASGTPRCVIRDTSGNIVAHVSYNGRVWAGADWKEGAIPLYDPRQEAH